MSEHRCPECVEAVQQAYAAGVQAGIGQGRMESVRAEVGAFSTAGALVDWAMSHHLAAVAHGTEYADYVNGDTPGGDRQ